jgi:4-hydroxybenzoate polyprenyltransferase
MKTLSRIQKLIEVEKTLFSLPWIMATVLFACVYKKISFFTIAPITFLWIGLAFFCARVAGMSFNRLIDRFFDAENPRTRDRLLPSGEATTLQVALCGWLAIAGMLLSAYFLNWLCVFLSPLAVLFLVGYSYAKRFTPFCHFIMSTVHGLALMATWIALTGEFNIVLLPLMFSIIASIGATDMIYGCQDEAYDRARGLYSMAVCYGVPKTLTIAYFLHILAALALIPIGFTLRAPFLFTLGAAVLMYVYLSAYRQLNASSLNDIMPFFFRSNLLAGAVILALFIAVYTWNASL